MIDIIIDFVSTLVAFAIVFSCIEAWQYRQQSRLISEIRKNSESCDNLAQQIQEAIAMIKERVDNPKRHIEPRSFPQKKPDNVRPQEAAGGGDESV